MNPQNPYYSSDQSQAGIHPGQYNAQPGACAPPAHSPNLPQGGAQGDPSAHCSTVNNQEQLYASAAPTFVDQFSQLNIGAPAPQLSAPQLPAPQLPDPQLQLKLQSPHDQETIQIILSFVLGLGYFTKKQRDVLMLTSDIAEFRAKDVKELAGIEGQHGQKLAEHKITIVGQVYDFFLGYYRHQGSQHKFHQHMKNLVPLFNELQSWWCYMFLYFWHMKNVEGKLVQFLGYPL